MAEARHRPAVVLDENWQAVLETARRLIEFETLSGEALNATLSTVGHIEIERIPLPEPDDTTGERRERRN